MADELKMQPSRLDTIQAPAIGSRNPGTITHASKVPVRVVVRNVGAVIVFIAHSSLELSKVGSSSGVYQLPPGAVETFILAPTQAIFVAGAGAVGRVCFAVSEAWPFIGTGPVTDTDTNGDC